MENEGSPAIFLAPGVGFAPLSQPYQALGIRPDATHDELIVASRAEEVSSAWHAVFLTDPARRLAWHAVGAPLWNLAPRVETGGVLAFPLAGVAEVLRRTVYERRAADALWPEVREALADALETRSKRAGDELAALGTRLGLARTEAAAQEVLRALRVELFPLLHMTIAAALEDSPDPHGSGEVHAEFADAPLFGKDNVDALTAPAKIHRCLRRALGNRVDGWTLGLLSNCVELFARGLDPEERWRSRGVAYVLACRLGEAIRRGPTDAADVLRIADALVEASPLALHARTAVAGALYARGRAANGPPLLLARAAALVPEFPEPRVVLRERLAKEGDAAAREAQMWLDTAGRGFGTARVVASACELVSAAVPDLSSGAVLDLAQLALTGGAERAARAAGESSAPAFRAAFAGAGEPAEIVARAGALPVPAVPRFSALESSLLASVSGARKQNLSRVPVAKSLARSLWLRSRRDRAVKALAIGGTLAALVGAGLDLRRVLKVTEIEHDYADVQSAILRRDLAATRRAAAAFMLASDRERDSAARDEISQAWRDAIWGTVRVADGDELTTLASEAKRVESYQR